MLRLYRWGAAEVSDSNSLIYRHPSSIFPSFWPPYTVEIIRLRARELVLMGESYVLPKDFASSWGGEVEIISHTND
eukprot:scaffold3443_cov258-Alexandrium_tamarense.AAC.2